MQILEKFIKYIPFTYMWFVRILIGNPKTVLDVGCGDGKFMSLIKDSEWIVTGIDIHKKTAKQAIKSNVYEEVLVGDLIKVCKKLVKQKKKYDLVFCSQVIEHITKKEGEILLDLVEKLYKEKIYIGTPRGYLRQGQEHIKENKYQDHKSGWFEDDFKNRGYRVYGIGFSLIWSDDGVVRHSNFILRYTLVFISFFFSPIVFFFPHLASGLMAVKS